MVKYTFTIMDKGQIVRGILFLLILSGVGLLTISAEAGQVIILDNVSFEVKQAAEKAIFELPKTNNIQLFDPENPSGLTEEQKNRIVIKFIDGTRPEDVLQEAGINSISIEEINHPLPIYKMPEDVQDKSLTGNSESWYWQLGDKHKEGNKDLEEGKELFHLGYRVTLGTDIALAEAISKLRGNEKVEYVMPAYLLDR